MKVEENVIKSLSSLLHTNERKSRQVCRAEPKNYRQDPHLSSEQIWKEKMLKYMKDAVIRGWKEKERFYG
jgi:hypothetical protein